jgi:hypothetical protein
MARAFIPFVRAIPPMYDQSLGWVASSIRRLRRFVEKTQWYNRLVWDMEKDCIQPSLAGLVLFYANVPGIGPLRRSAVRVLHAGLLSVAPTHPVRRFCAHGERLHF